LRKLFYFFLFALVFSGCSLDYREAMIGKELLETVPDTILINFKYTRVRQGQTLAVVEGKSGKTFSKKNETVLKHVHFIEYNGKGDILNEGWADNAVYNNDTGNARITGDIKVYSEKEKASINAEELHWTAESKLLKGNKDELILLKKDDGSYIEGKGFTADLKDKSIEFFSDVKGQYVGKKE